VRLGALCMASIVLTFSPAASSLASASSPTYKAGGVRFQAAFLSKVTTTPLTSAELTKGFSGVAGVVAATVFSAGVAATAILAGVNRVPKPNAIEMTVVTFDSASAAKGFWKFYGTAPGVKRESIDGKSAYAVVGNAVTLNSGTPVPDKNATQGDLAVLLGKSVLVGLVETKVAAATTKFFKSVKFPR